MTSIISYNVNGIRAAIRKGLWDWASTENPDILCVQETKAMREDVGEVDSLALGYKSYWHSAEKKGYSGVAVFTKKEPDQVVIGCGMPKYDSEGRIIRLDFGDWTLLNCYFPSGTSGDHRQEFKMEFLADISAWIADLRHERPNLVIVGDYNIAHQEIDIHDPKGNKKSSGFLPEERAWMTQWLENGFTDTFRALNPELVEYSWWSARPGVRERNKGWRIDYQCVTAPISDKIKDARQLTSIVHSDHCPVKLVIDL